MKPKILIMGKKQDYYEAEVSRSRLQKEISKMAVMIKEEELLYNLRIEDNKIPANQLKNYGGMIPLTEGIVGNETIVDGLERFFEKTDAYAKKHGVDYVLIQDLKLKQSFQTFDIYGLAKLLIE